MATTAHQIKICSSNGATAQRLAEREATEIHRVWDGDTRRFVFKDGSVLEVTRDDIAAFLNIDEAQS